MNSPHPKQSILIFIQKVLPWIFLLAALYQVRLIASSAIGKESFFDVWIVWMSNAKVTRMSAFVFGLMGVAYGLAQRALRRAAEQKLRGRIVELEAAAEAGRAQ